MTKKDAAICNVICSHAQVWALNIIITYEYAENEFPLALSVGGNEKGSALEAPFLTTVRKLWLVLRRKVSLYFL